jgi:hypothetical protein
MRELWMAKTVLKIQMLVIIIMIMMMKKMKMTRIMVVRESASVGKRAPSTSEITNSRKMGVPTASISAKNRVAARSSQKKLKKIIKGMPRTLNVMRCIGKRRVSFLKRWKRHTKEI